MITPNCLVSLHPEAKEISFKHKFIILHTFKKRILGILGIDYISLMLIDANKVLTIYSSCPALEYNLIHNNLWQYDGIFDVRNHKIGTFVFWDDLYHHHLKNTLILEKERTFGFQFGFYTMKNIADLFVIYSFATKEQTDKEVYKQSTEILNKIGDYFFAELRKIHQQYITSSRPNHHIRLVVNNT